MIRTCLGDTKDIQGCVGSRGFEWSKGSQREFAFHSLFPRVEREARDASRRLLKLLLKLLLKPISILTGIVPYYIDKLSRLASLAGESSDIRVISLVGSVRSLGNHLISK